MLTSFVGSVVIYSSGGFIIFLHQQIGVPLKIVFLAGTVTVFIENNDDNKSNLEE